MLITTRMSRLTIAGPNNFMEKVIRELHKIKAMHIVDHVKSEDVDIGKPLEISSRLSEILVRVRSLSSYLKVRRENGIDDFEVKKGFSEIDKLTKDIHTLVTGKLNKIKEIEEKLKIARANKEVLEKITSVHVPLEAFTSYKSLSYFAGTIEKQGRLVEELEKITSRFEIYISSEEKPTIALFIEAGKREEASKLLSKYNFSEINITNIIGMKGTPSENLQKIAKEEEQFVNRRSMVEGQLDSIRKRWSYFLILSEDRLSTELEKVQAPLRFATTKNTFVVSGWVPKKKVDELQKRLNKITKEKIFIQVEDIKKGDKIPVELDNPKGVKTFEFFMDLYTMPDYRETDPTFFVFLIFPLLFGFMLGDMGYGLITLIVALLFKKIFPGMKRFFNIFVFASAATVFFGFLFGEVFGEEVIFGYELWHVLSRAHQIDILLGISIVFGIFHLLFGFAIGFVNVYRQHGLKHAIYEKFGWILLFPGLAKIIQLLDLVKGAPGRLLELMVPNNAIIISLAVIGMVLLIIGEGVVGAVEVPSLFGNILSYARLMAIGLASVQLALVVNEFVKEFFHAGGIMILAGVLLLIVGHGINILLGWVGCFLHSLRLHYVEFFTKFFKGGAKRFQPFGLKA